MTVFVRASESEMQMGGQEGSWSQGGTDGVAEEKMGRGCLPRGLAWGLPFLG